MSAPAPTAPPPPGPETAPSRWRPRVSLHGIVGPLMAALATIAVATALTGVVQGWSWFGDIVTAALLIAGTGIVLRILRLHPFLVGAAQLGALLLLVTGSFTTGGVLGLFPGPQAFGELHQVLTAGFADIRTGLPPVEASAGIRCLIMITVGLVALVVDLLAVTAAAPAATGLLLLCVYAVPSALTPELLPWWTFVLGVVAYAALLAVDGSHRHRVWRTRAPARGSGAGVGSMAAPSGLVATAVAAGLLAGATLTFVGTEGSLPGSEPDRQSAPGGLGVEPFTSLRGMLGDRTPTRMFEVDGLGDNAPLMRAFTLSRYIPGQGWGLPDGRRMPAGRPADGPLPTVPGDTVSGEARTVRVTPVNWFDVWLPTYGKIRNLDPPPGDWYYDPGSGSVYSEDRRRPRSYTMTTSLSEPTREQLRAAGTVSGPDPRYREVARIDPRVRALAQDLTSDAPTTFGKAQAVWRYFTDPSNGFVYDTETAPASDPDALADFVLRGKRGFCEQYASAMAVMLRSLDVPSRVAVGFTRGTTDGQGTRVLTSEDAHAWVEVYFGDELGWVTFDPTPLTNGRGYTPDYLDTEDNPAPDDPDESSQVPDSSTPASEPSRPADAPEQQARGEGAGPPPQWPGWLAGILLVLTTGGVAVLGRRVATTRAAPVAVVSAVVAAWGVTLVLAAWLVHWAVALGVFVVVAGLLGPACARELIRRRRLAEVSRVTAASPDAAWREVRAECTDRGLDLPSTATLRQAAETIGDRLELDDTGRRELQTIVSAVERAWYSPAAGAGEEGHGSAQPEDSPRPKLDHALAGLRESLARCAPLSWRRRVLPRSLLHRRDR
ncbi:transglutaminase-like putative cysteine protease [Prauserella sediminis]|uniref:Transglutaminase-like putative cysteine protease n=1 Tax=Prauserella sediminis TaxID=577680 RepID=A0A839XQP4_9PSEU|nr:DUF3488 and transglutaminase-like domain-containing protein [Prauserella sediminis]MBB3665051.1 transglutaminase-like putative cysteine protease [Prauserella sediminis]